MTIATRWLAAFVLIGATGILFLVVRPIETSDPGLGESTLASLAEVAPTPQTVDVARAAHPLPFVSVDNRREVRDLVAYAKAAESRDIPTLRRAVRESPDAVVVANALKALGRLGALELDATTLSLLHDERIRVRHEAVRALGLTGDPAAVDSLLEIVDGPDVTMCALALHSLGRIGGPKAKSKLKTIAGDGRGTPESRAFAKSALAMIERDAKRR